MARLARLFAPSIPQYVVQRAAEGRLICTDVADYRFLLETLEQAVREHGLALHAYVLLPTEIRLLATAATAASLARTMQALGRRYVPYANARVGRSGTLWRSRFRSTLLDPADYLLAVMRHVERRPVEVGVASEPSDWQWSSYAHHAGLRTEPFVNDHAAYWSLSDTPFGRQAAYRTTFASSVADHSTDPPDPIEAALHRGWALGGPTFVETLEEHVNRRPLPLQRGRPRRG